MCTASLRCSTKPRDYIFATMPQFPWYKLPQHAKSLSFNDVFFDFCSQASTSGHGSAHRFTASMTDPKTCLDQAQAWAPSKEQPEPACLGDFMKLLGNKLSSRSVAQESAHLTMGVSVELISTEDVELVLQIIDSAMLFSPRLWGESHKSGELSAHGSFPDPDWYADESENIDSKASSSSQIKR